MNIEIPHYEQEDDNTCALACLRMILAAYGTHVQEAEIKALAVEAGFAAVSGGARDAAFAVHAVNLKPAIHRGET